MNLPDNSFVFGVGLAFGWSVTNGIMAWIKGETYGMLHYWSAHFRYRRMGVLSEVIHDHEPRIFRRLPFACATPGCPVCKDLGLLPTPAPIDFQGHAMPLTCCTCGSTDVNAACIHPTAKHCAHMTSDFGSSSDMHHVDEPRS